MSVSATNTTAALIDFIKRSPTPFHTVDNIKKLLLDSGARLLSESDDTVIEPGNTYVITRSGSSVISFRVPESPKGFMISASHTDSPCFKLKPVFEKNSAAGTVTLDTERYGGSILSSWMDRPLSVAGRVALKTDAGIGTRSVDLDCDLLVIPNVCIHFNRTVNDGYKFNPQTDMAPLYASGADHTALIDKIASRLGVNAADIVAHDLYLYNRCEGCVWGADGEFFSAPRIDDLQCTYATLMGFISSPPTDRIQVFAAFDNEETGSSSKQGAASTFLYDTLKRICEDLSITDSAYVRMLASSLMISADNAHALHPNHPEYYDQANAPVINGGVVIKTNANQKYTTDAVSASLFKRICERAEIPVQCFANRSDILGGSTLGNISNTKVALNTVDIGLAQLAMHSAYESAGVEDTEYLVRASRAFFGSSITCIGDGEYEIR